MGKLNPNYNSNYRFLGQINKSADLLFLSWIDCLIINSSINKNARIIINRLKYQCNFDLVIY